MSNLKTKNDTFSKIQKFLIVNADGIQKRATQQHKKYLGGVLFRSEIISKYQQNHIKLVRALADNLTSTNIKKNSIVFKKLGNTLARDSVKDGLTIKEAIDGIVFLKQAVWEKLEKKGFLDKLTKDDFYKVTHVSGTLVDIAVSQIAQTYQGVYKRRKEKQETNKNEFIGLISHELKTPVTSVKAFAQVLQKRFSKLGDEQSALLLMKMDGQLSKLTGLIGDLIDVTKIETGKLQFNMKFFDLNELTKEVVEEMQRTTEKHKIITKFDKTKTLYGDRDRVGQVLTNLLTNAIKYSPRADKIIVSTKTFKDEAQLCIQDFGVGIPKDAQDRIFDQFYRVEGKDEKTFSGMGLGLFVSSEIVKRHNGKIWVESEKGKGSTFCFTLPVKKVRQQKTKS